MTTSNLSNHEKRVLERATTDYLSVALLHEVDGKLVEPDLPDYERRTCGFALDRETGELTSSRPLEWIRSGWFPKKGPIVSHVAVCLPSSGLMISVVKLNEPMEWSAGLTLDSVRVRSALATRLQLQHSGESGGGL